MKIDLPLKKNIAFVGSHCAGKTTKVEVFAIVLRSLGFSVALGEEFASRCPYLINDESGILAQEWIFDGFKRVWETYTDPLLPTLECDFYIFDRCILDHIPYTLRLIDRGNILPVAGQGLINRTMKYWYDRMDGKIQLFYCPVLPLTASNPKRSLDAEFQLDIDRRYREWLFQYKIPFSELKR